MCRPTPPARPPDGSSALVKIRRRPLGWREYMRKRSLCSCGAAAHRREPRRRPRRDGRRRSGSRRGRSSSSTTRSRPSFTENWVQQLAVRRPCHEQHLVRRSDLHDKAQLGPVLFAEQAEAPQEEALYDVSSRTSRRRSGATASRSRARTGRRRGESSMNPPTTSSAATGYEDIKSVTSKGKTGDDRLQEALRGLGALSRTASMPRTSSRART